MGGRPHVLPGEQPSRPTQSQISKDFKQGRAEAALNSNGIYYDSNNQIQDVTMLDTTDDPTQTIRGRSGRAQTLRSTGLTQWLSGTPRLGRTQSQAHIGHRRSGKCSRIRGHKHKKRGRGAMEARTLHDFLQGVERPRQPKTHRHTVTGNKQWGIDQDKSALAFRIIMENVNSLSPWHHNNHKLNTIQKFDRYYSVDVLCMSELNMN